MNDLGKINYDINRISSNPPLVVADDEITVNCTFLYVLEDYGMAQGITAQDQLWVVRKPSARFEHKYFYLASHLVLLFRC